MRISTLLTLALVLAASGCAKRQLQKMDSEEAELAAQFDGSEYSEDMVQAGNDEVYEDQGDSISPQALASIQDTITNVYERDFGRCLQQDMDAYDNRWIAGTFTVEFKINTDGRIIEVNLLEEDIEERRLPPGQKKARKAKIFGTCIETAIYKWEFEVPPEVEYVHTYTGKVGEAF